VDTADPEAEPMFTTSTISRFCSDHAGFATTAASDITMWAG
jgi:hypothetical protein